MATPDGGRSCEWHFHVLSWTFWSRLDGNEYHADKDEGELTFIFQFVCTCGHPHWYSTPVYMWTLVNAQCGQVSASVCVLWASLSGSILGYWSHSFPSSPFFFLHQTASVFCLFFSRLVPLTGWSEGTGSMERAINGWGAVYGLVSHHCRYSRWNTFLDLYTDDISAQRRRREPKLAFTHWVLLVCSDLSFLHLQLSSQPSQCVLLPISKDRSESVCLHRHSVFFLMSPSETLSYCRYI